jgi:hypothetical protein
MRRIIIGILLATLFGVPPALAGSNADKAGDAVETVRKTCECVRRHPNGFPYIEPRITTCRTFKNAEGHVKALDCLNCYAICADKPAG